MLDTLTADTFEAHLGSAFAVNAEGNEDVLTLIEVERYTLPGNRDRAPFALTFHGGRDDAMYDSQVLPMDHAELGRLDIFISPFGRNEDGTFCYQAIFN
ncbi:hypothetical protein P1X14_12945 [Sphingomonas sp. AOB5]|uniref:DUF6916 family protein n=1 Tax=Sphingomonas sp. AOB5 TaxID=3034017 RepID=UPI0023F90F3B|nr:hypothetical protein [Sphingomonas sp. AOB5]MDF7776160.1 hypothetical protein [Sphingomonas sp. AOB5]